MATAAITHTFVDGATIEASEHNQNFTDLVTFLNTYCIQKDASLAFTAHPSGPATDPSTDNQYARKAYVDKQAGGVLGLYESPATGGVATASVDTADLQVGSMEVTVDLTIDHYYRAELLVPGFTFAAVPGAWRSVWSIYKTATMLTKGFVWHSDDDVGTIHLWHVWKATASASGVVFKAKTSTSRGTASDLYYSSALPWTLAVTDLGV